MSRLINSVPAILGYYPQDSIVLLPHDSGKITKKTRLDLSTGGIRHDLRSPDDGSDPCILLINAVRELGWQNVIVLVVGGQRHQEEVPPHTGLVDNLTRQMQLEGLVVLCAVWVPEIRSGARWLRYGVQPTRTGTLGQVRHGGLADAARHRLGTPFESVTAMEKMLSPDDTRSLLMRQVIAEDLSTATRSPRTEKSLRAAMLVVERAVAAAQGGELPRTRAQFVALAHALWDPIVYESSLRWAIWPERQDAATRLWMALTRVLSGLDRANAAVLLTTTAAMARHHQIAAIAARISTECNGLPHGHEFARALRYGVLPAYAVSWLEESVDRAMADFAVLCDGRG
ncbi:hypothetical protein JOF53_006566 [Crossiella equi]|uniref:DUF4192 domain-containing protein n=1 Tax=Crossiella equi TaxID=130796 RepID=A0ABS5AM94_9PSEU|nr:DUF4192 domain-containing protein [Crossiella equi]MBP2477694.1 hypothetical protein [Crossiella equi]